MSKVISKAAFGLPLLLCLFSVKSFATTLEEVLSSTQYHTAELPANNLRVSALHAMADSALQLPDPRLEFGVLNAPVQGNNHSRFTRQQMTVQKIGIMQEYISSTKRERAADVFNANARATESDEGIILARLQREAAQAWFSLVFSEKRLHIIEQTITDIVRQNKVQTAGVSGGTVSASSVLDVQLALSSIKNEEDNARSDIVKAQAKLLQLTGLKVTEATGSLPRINRLPADEDVLFQGIQLHPEVISASRQAELARAKSARSAVASIPNVGVEVYFARREDYEDLAGVMFTVDLPLFQAQRQDKDHAADLMRAYASEDDLTTLIREQRNQLSALISNYNAVKAINDRQHQVVLPLLQKKVMLLNAQYQQGTSGMNELLAARREQLSGRIESVNTEKSMADAWTAIRYLVPEGAE